MTFSIQVSLTYTCLQIFRLNQMWNFHESESLPRFSFRIIVSLLFCLQNRTTDMMAAVQTSKSTQSRPRTATRMSKLVSFVCFLSCCYKPVTWVFIGFFSTWQSLIPNIQSVILACTNCGTRTERIEVCQRCLQLAKCKYCLRHLPPHCFHAKDNCHACHRNMTKTRVRHAVDQIVNETSIPTSSGDMSFDQFIEDNATCIRQIVNTYRQRFGCVTLFFSLSL